MLLAGTQIRLPSDRIVISITAVSNEIPPQFVSAVETSSYNRVITIIAKWRITVEQNNKTTEAEKIKTKRIRKIYLMNLKKKETEKKNYCAKLGDVDGITSRALS